jgi:two-component system phosphate regulon sensor histidine kinase PhoR
MMPIMGEVDQLRQLFSNLIENAIKYSGSECEVKIFLSKEKHKGMVGIVIEDNGRGISAEHLPRLTERFYRANTNSEAEKEGTGLGLAIVKHILIRHRGKLQIDSKLDKGSQFTAWLPKGNLGKQKKNKMKKNLCFQYLIYS